MDDKSDMTNMTDRTDRTYKPQDIEAKWQEEWEKSGIFSPDISNAKSPYYNLMMFPYPSAEGLHVGNMYAFTGADVYAKFQRMHGKDVLEPIGLDGFGIHSENYALKIGKHPLEQSKIAEGNFYRQLRSIGNSFDWKRTVETYDPEYYKWTQWLFIQLFKAGFAYRDTALVNWCPSCLTVLSDEQVIDGKCERCGTQVQKKDLEQWFFRITSYAARLLNNIDGLKWTEKVKIAQRNWIGKSEGAEIQFSIHNSQFTIRVFTTRPDTLFGATFLILAPEHELVTKLLLESRSIKNESGVNEGSSHFSSNDNDGLGNGENKSNRSNMTDKTNSEDINSNIKEYIEKVNVKSEQERIDLNREKTGVFTGLYAINPVNGKEIPIWISDYVLAGYGTGAIMAVPAHDQRDFKFAKKYGLEIKEVIRPVSSIKYQILSNVEKTRKTEIIEAYNGNGKLINSTEWDGWEVPKDMGKVLSYLEAKGVAKRRSNYHLRDWLISRQRYWGPPIPMVYCESCHEAGKSWFDSQEGQESRLEVLGKVEGNKTDKSYTIDRTNNEDNTNEEIKIGNSMQSMVGWFPVNERELPVRLPEVSDWRPMGSGKSPLDNHPEFYNAKCPNCGGNAKRETDVSDTFLDSAWYFLRYPSVGGNDFEAAFDKKISEKWLPVDQYIGGAEHSVLHLLYSRFIWMVLYDLGYFDFSAKGGPASGWEEPFTNFFAHGLIIKDGAKMSKSKGNVVVPDEYISKYGADTLRTYLMFIGPYSDGGDFSDSGIEGTYKFLKKVWRLLQESIESRIMSHELREEEGLENKDKTNTTDMTDRTNNESLEGLDNSESSPPATLREALRAGRVGSNSNERERVMHRTIKGVSEDINSFKYNTAIAKLMEYYNYLSHESGEKEGLSKEEVETYLKLLAPFAPHMTEELWQRMSHELRGMSYGRKEGLSNGDKNIDNKSDMIDRTDKTNNQEILNQVQNDYKFNSIHLSVWPEFDPNLITSSEVVIPIQINGKRRGQIGVRVQEIGNRELIEEMAKKEIEKQLEGLSIKKIIYVEGKIVNFVI